MPSANAGPPEPVSCGMTKLGSVEVSTEAGIGQVEVHGSLAAVVQREEGLVALVDVSDPSEPTVLGRYDGNTGQSQLDDPLDGDLAFSSDGRYLFYARQTHQYSNEGLHVLDIEDPAQPTLVASGPQGGTLRVAYHEVADAEYLVTLDAITGMVVYRFERTPGVLIPLHVDALPALKVGGPASAGLFIDPEDPELGIPLLYVATGRTGLQVFDLSTPAAPTELGTWGTEGLADIEVVSTPVGRTVYAATEYWFGASTPPRILELDATDLSAIAERRRLSPGDPAYPAGIRWRVQGIEVADGRLYLAHSHAGLGVLETADLEAAPVAATTDLGEGNRGGEFRAISPYAMDVEVAGDGLVLVSDASTGVLSLFLNSQMG